MINEKIVHKIYGEGVILTVRDTDNPHKKYVDVQFAIGIKTLAFPMIFAQKLVTTDSAALTEEARLAIEAIEKEDERARMARQIATLKAELESAQNQLEVLESHQKHTKAKNIHKIGSVLSAGVVYGTSSKNIYGACCDALGWDESKITHFGWQTPCYTEVGTLEGYSVWFLTYNNWTKNSETKEVENKIYDGYMEQWWRKANHDKATARKRVVFAINQEQKYVFLGVYIFDENERIEVKDGKTYYVERFNRISTQYPES